MAKHPTDSTRPSRTQTARRPITLELAATVCPNAQIAANIARHFALDTVDYDAVREAHEEAVGNMAKACSPISAANWRARWARWALLSKP